MRASRGVLRALALAALIALLAGCTPAPGRLVVDDETGALDRAQAERAAAPLVARGATVAVLVAARGDETGADLARRLAAAGLLEGGQVAPGALALYVSYEPRYSELRAGARWSGRLPDGTLREVRTAALNPALREGRLAAGVAATLAALEERIANPPLVERLSRGLLWVVLGAFALAAVAVSPLGERLGGWWRRSPPGRLARWLGDRTPSGRRRLERIVRTTQLRLEDRVEYARSWCRAAAAGPRRGEAEPLMGRLKDLDHERGALSRAGLEGRALEAAMDRLAWAYEALGHEAARLAPAEPARKSRRGRGAASSAFIAGAATDGASGAGSPSSSDSSSGWDGGGGVDSGPSSDGGSW